MFFACYVPGTIPKALFICKDTKILFTKDYECIFFIVFQRNKPITVSFLCLSFVAV